MRVIAPSIVFGFLGACSVSDGSAVSAADEPSGVNRLIALAEKAGIRSEIEACDRLNAGPPIPGKSPYAQCVEDAINTRQSSTVFEELCRAVQPNFYGNPIQPNGRCYYPGV